MPRMNNNVSQSLLYRIRRVRLTVKIQIWMTVTRIVWLFSFFMMFYLTAVQESSLPSNFNIEV